MNEAILPITFRDCLSAAGVPMRFIDARRRETR
jgi:hypothetical protein